MAYPRCEHWAIVKRAFKYLWGTSKYSILYHSDLLGDHILVNIQGWLYFNWVRDVDRRRYTNKYFFLLFGGVMSWMSK